MKIAIATEGEEVAAHFGRCQGYILLSLSGGKVAAKEIVASPEHAPGVIPKFLFDHGVRHVVCGGIGRKAQEAFRMMGVEITAGISGNVQDVIAGLGKGELLSDSKVSCPKEVNDE